MRFRVEVVCTKDDGVEERRAVAELQRQELAMETLGLTLAEGKAILEGVQDIVTGQQIAEDLARRRPCAGCGRPRKSKEGKTACVKTLFGAVTVPNPRWKRCRCQEHGPKTFRPVKEWLHGRSSPELLYVETKWGSLAPFAKVADLLKEVLPVGDELNQERVRRHLHETAARLERELGEEKPSLVEGTDEDWETLPVPDGPMTVGIDGGYVRAAHKQGFFEVIAGKSVVAFRRDGDEGPPPKRFGFVQTYDQKPRRRLWELMKSQGMQENQAVTFLTDGGDDVRQVQQYLHPQSEHIVDWFHITMRVTVLGQQTKTLSAERDEIGAAAAKAIESIKGSSTKSGVVAVGRAFQALPGVGSPPEVAGDSGARSVQVTHPTGVKAWPPTLCCSPARSQSYTIVDGRGVTPRAGSGSTARSTPEKCGSPPPPTEEVERRAREQREAETGPSMGASAPLEEARRSPQRSAGLLEQLEFPANRHYPGGGHERTSRMPQPRPER